MSQCVSIASKVRILKVVKGIHGRAVAPSGQTWRHTVGLEFAVPAGIENCSGVIVEDDLILTAAHCRIPRNSPVSCRSSTR